MHNFISDFCHLELYCFYLPLLLIFLVKYFNDCIKCILVMYHCLSVSLLLIVFILFQVLTTISSAVFESSEVISRWKKNKIAMIFKILATGETRNETIFPFSLPGKGEGLN